MSVAVALVAVALLQVVIKCLEQFVMVFVWLLYVIWNCMDQPSVLHTTSVI